MELQASRRRKGERVRAHAWGPVTSEDFTFALRHYSCTVPVHVLTHVPVLHYHTSTGSTVSCCCIIRTCSDVPATVTGSVTHAYSSEEYLILFIHTVHQTYSATYYYIVVALLVPRCDVDDILYGSIRMSIRDPVPGNKMKPRPRIFPRGWLFQHSLLERQVPPPQS